MKNRFEKDKVAVLEHQIYYVYSRVAAENRQSDLPTLPIILLHGAIVSHLYWMPTAHKLAEMHDVYALDFPGHGLSSKPEHALPVVQQADVTAAWLDVMNLGKVIIAANSYACEIAVELAIRYPDKVDCLILTAPASDPSEPTLRQQGMRLIRDAVYEPPTMGLVLLWDAFLIGIKRGVETCKYMIQYDYISRLPLVKHQSLVVRGSKDTVATQDWVERVNSLLPDSELVIIPGGPHDINYGKPDELCVATNNFLRKRVNNQVKHSGD